MPAIVAPGWQGQNVPTPRKHCIHRFIPVWCCFAIWAFDDTSKCHVTILDLIAGNFPQAEQATIELSNSDVTWPAEIHRLPIHKPNTWKIVHAWMSRPLQCHADKTCSAHFSNHPSGKLRHKTSEYNRYDASHPKLNDSQSSYSNRHPCINFHHTGTKSLEEQKNHTTYVQVISPN